MMSHRFPLAAVVALVLLMAGCGFHLRKEAELPPSMQRVHVELVDASSPLGRDLRNALTRAGAQVVDAVGESVAVMNIRVDSLSTDVLSVGGAARANEYAIRYHVEFTVENAAGTALLPKQVVELSREFTFDATQALGVAAETDLLTKELRRDMVQTILRRLEALAHAEP